MTEQHAVQFIVTSCSVEIWDMKWSSVKRSENNRKKKSYLIPFLPKTPEQKSLSSQRSILHLKKARECTG